MALMLDQSKYTFKPSHQKYRSVFFKSEAQAKQLGRDIILYALRKQRSVLLYVHRKKDNFYSHQFCYLSSLFPYCVQNDGMSQLFSLSLGFKKPRTKLVHLCDWKTFSGDSRYSLIFFARKARLLFCDQTNKILLLKTNDFLGPAWKELIWKFSSSRITVYTRI